MADDNEKHETVAQALRAVAAMTLVELDLRS